MKNFEELENVNIVIDYQKLDDSFWNELSNIIYNNNLKFIEETNSMKLSFLELHRKFDL